MVRFSLYKRHLSGGVYYYVRFWNPEKKNYDAGISIEMLRTKLGEDSIRRIGTRSAAAAIAVRAYEEGLTKKEKKSPNFIEYVLNFWDFDNSSYVKLKNKTKKNSIGRDHCLNMLGTFKRNFMPRINPSLKLSEITQNDIEAVIISLIDEGKISAATINNVILSVQKPLNEAFARGMIKTNPMQNIHMLQRDQKDRGIPTKAEVEAVLEYLRKEGFAGRISMKIYLAVALAATTGMRQGEIRALRKDAIEFVENDLEYEDQAIITVRENYAKTDGFKSTKGKRVRHVPVSKTLAEELIRMADKNPHKDTLIFWSDSSPDTPIAGSYINKYYYAALAAIGITEEKRRERNIDFHSLRHFFNSMLRGQIDDNNLRLIVGHQSERMSDNYTHEVRERLLQIGKVSSNIIAFPKSS